MLFNLKSEVKLKYALLMSIIFLLTSCGEIRLIGAYDQTVDQSIHKLSRDVSILLIELKKNITDQKLDENAYSNFRPKYIDIQGEIETLKIRCGALEKYGKVRQQVLSLELNILNLEAFHKTGFQSIEPINNIQKNFEVAFTNMIALQNGLKREK